MNNLSENHDLDVTLPQEVDHELQDMLREVWGGDSEQESDASSEDTLVGNGWKEEKMEAEIDELYEFMATQRQKKKERTAEDLHRVDDETPDLLEQSLVVSSSAERFRQLSDKDVLERISMQGHGLPHLSQALVEHMEADTGSEKEAGSEREAETEAGSEREVDTEARSEREAEAVVVDGDSDNMSGVQRFTDGEHSTPSTEDSDAVDSPKETVDIDADGNSSEGDMSAELSCSLPQQVGAKLQNFMDDDEGAEMCSVLPSETKLQRSHFQLEDNPIGVVVQKDYTMGSIDLTEDSDLELFSTPSPKSCASLCGKEPHLQPENLDRKGADSMQLTESPTLPSLQSATSPCDWETKTTFSSSQLLDIDMSCCSPHCDKDLDDVDRDHKRKRNKSETRESEEDFGVSKGRQKNALLDARVAAIDAEPTHDEDKNEEEEEEESIGDIKLEMLEAEEVEEAMLLFQEDVSSDNEKDKDGSSDSAGNSAVAKDVAEMEAGNQLLGL